MKEIPIETLEKVAKETTEKQLEVIENAWMNKGFFRTILDKLLKPN